LSGILLLRCFAPHQPQSKTAQRTVLCGIGSTAGSLKAAIEGETYECTSMYPPVLEQAEAEGHLSGGTPNSMWPQKGQR
jgi:rubrerythrin